MIYCVPDFLLSARPSFNSHRVKLNLSTSKKGLADIACLLSSRSKHVSVQLYISTIKESMMEKGRENM